MVAGQSTQMTLEEFQRLFQELSNWGRWGPEDQRGALNYITDEKRRTAAALVKDGVTVSAALPLNTAAAVDNPRPVVHLMVRAGDVGTDAVTAGSADYIAIAPHGLAHTHIDALCHMFFQGQMYNGRPASLVTSQGANANAIDVAQDGIVGRGVLLDIPRLKRLDWLEPGYAISPDDLEKAERAAGLKVESGDILLVNTGRSKRRKALGPWDFAQEAAGLHIDCLPWLHEREVAVMGSDGVSDVKPHGVKDIRDPIHIITIVAMGLHLLDNCDLDALSEACAARNRWEFMLTVAPLRILRGTASPINPIAVF